jgi:hypothetical protein
LSWWRTPNGSKALNEANSIFPTLIITVTVFLRIRLVLRMIIGQGRSAMQVQQPNRFEGIGAVGDVTNSQLPSPPASMDPSDYLSPIREEALQLLNPGVDRARVVWLAAAALAIGFGLGWAGSSSWYDSPVVVASNPLAQKDNATHRTEMKSANKVESGRKQTALGTGTNNSPKPPGLSTGAIPRPDGGSSRATTEALPADASLPTGSIAPREPLVPTPETRPTTIEGWIVRDVRGGTVVLEGPDGSRTAMVGDTVPGVGRIDSIVRWGNRWIVAADKGLIATP